MLSVNEYRRQIRAAGDDKAKLAKLHAEITESIGHAYGEERVALTRLRQELKEYMRSSFGTGMGR